MALGTRAWARPGELSCGACKAQDRAWEPLNNEERDVSLTARGFDILAFFVAHPGRVYSCEQLMQAVWGARYTGTARTVDNFVARLRSHIGDDGEKPRHFETVRGYGYRFHAVRDLRSTVSLANIPFVKATVHQGRLVLDEPTDLPEGTEIELMPLDSEPLSNEERARVDAALERSADDVAAGRLHSLAEALAEIDKPR